VAAGPVVGGDHGQHQRQPTKQLMRSLQQAQGQRCQVPGAEVERQVKAKLPVADQAECRDSVDGRVAENVMDGSVGDHGGNCSTAPTRRMALMLRGTEKALGLAWIRASMTWSRSRWARG